ncbi:hypothetical protein D922_04216 [Enterococcus faecalis 06-MB-DW-09]|nr:hypothetical protein D931_02431 [Enterococcus faecium 13.SD.W.09]EPH87288.1 hypothetical protein D922_04216 [Enterococcus faecalis 06-MB-DW-09]
MNQKAQLKRILGPCKQHPTNQMKAAERHSDFFICLVVTCWDPMKRSRT